MLVCRTMQAYYEDFDNTCFKLTVPSLLKFKPSLIDVHGIHWSFASALGFIYIILTQELSVWSYVVTGGYRLSLKHTRTLTAVQYV